MHSKTSFFPIVNLFFTLVSLIILSSCTSKKSEQKEEQIRISTSESTGNNDSLLNSIKGDIPLTQVATQPNSVILSGLANHRLVTVYKAKGDVKPADKKYSYSRYYYDYEGEEPNWIEHFMPGIDILYGYNLLNIAHYNMTTEKLNSLFDHPVLIKTLYYPSFIQDSLYNKPINRNYFLVSVYDEDTNKDTLINKKDLRRFYHFDADCKVKTRIIPADYSVVRSQYDPKNDVMYLFAIYDEDKNGTGDKTEPVHIFWFGLKTPGVAKRLY